MQDSLPQDQYRIDVFSAFLVGIGLVCNVPWQTFSILLFVNGVNR